MLQNLLVFLSNFFNSTLHIFDHCLQFGIILVWFGLEIVLDFVMESISNHGVEAIILSGCFRLCLHYKTPVLLFIKVYADNVNELNTASKDVSYMICAGMIRLEPLFGFFSTISIYSSLMLLALRINVLDNIS